jgi:two-component system response regulator DevR
MSTEKVLFYAQLIRPTVPRVPPGALRNAERRASRRGGEASMALAVQVVSSHLLGARDIEQTLSVQKALGKLLVPHAASEAAAIKQPNCPRLFLLDGCSLNLPLGPVSSRLRANSPGSKFLALLPPHRSGGSEMMPLFHWGIDGFVTLHEKWKTELPKAVMAMLRGGIWVPSEVLLTFINQMKTLLDKQLMAGESLTAREGQVFQLLFRHLTNKEIACQLNISERTAKFHVCNLLRKLGLENRRNFPVHALVN